MVSAFGAEQATESAVKLRASGAPRQGRGAGTTREPEPSRPGQARAGRLGVSTTSGTVLDGVLFSAGPSRQVVIAITGIHGNFHSNPFYVNFGQTFAEAGVDFVYAQTRDAYGRIATRNVLTGRQEIIGSWNEDFAHADEDIAAYVDAAVELGYERIVLAGHSLGANKVISYLSHTKDPRVERFILLSPANVEHLLSAVTEEQKGVIERYMCEGRGGEMLPFALLGWIECTASTAYGWVFDNPLDNVHVEADKDFSQVEALEHRGALLIGSYDRFTYGDPAGFLGTINSQMPRAAENEIVIVEGTGHTYQGREQQVADALVELVAGWLADAPSRKDASGKPSVQTAEPQGRAGAKEVK